MTISLISASFVSAGVASFVASFFVYVFGIRKHSLEVQHNFILRQLEEFYSPMAGYRRMIRLKSELRVRISNTASSAWPEESDQLAAQNKPVSEQDRAYIPYHQIIEYDNRQFTEEFMPIYRRMLELFYDKYWLADEDTRQHHEALLYFVEVWERQLAEALPSRVLGKLDHTEENLKPFYDHIEDRLSCLRSSIANPPSFWKTKL